MYHPRACSRSSPKHPSAKRLSTTPRAKKRPSTLSANTGSPGAGITRFGLGPKRRGRPMLVRGATREDINAALDVANIQFRDNLAFLELEDKSGPRWSV